MKHVGIVGVGTYLPKKILTNFDLEKMVDTSDDWIMTRTGIRERRLAGKGEATSDLAIQAAKRALKNAKLKAENLDLIMVATITPDIQFPSTACFVQAGLDAKNAVCFDVSAACAGFVYALITAQQFIARGVYKNALVIGAETLSSITDWKDRNTCVLFGDGAGAVVLAPVNQGGIVSSYLGSDGKQNSLLMLPGGGSRHPATHDTINKRMHYIKMHGNELFKFAVKIMADAVNRVLAQAGINHKDVDCLIPHQANLRIISAVAKKIGIPTEKIYLNIDRYGNMSSASTAVALCEAVEERRITKGDTVVLVAFGAGLVWGSCVIKW